MRQQHKQSTKSKQRTENCEKYHYCTECRFVSLKKTSTSTSNLTNDTVSTMMKAIFLVLLALVVPSLGFVSSKTRTAFTTHTSTSLFIGGPLNKLTKGKEYEKIVEGLMKTKGYSREKAEKETNNYLDDPNNYALQKVSLFRKLVSQKIGFCRHSSLTSIHHENRARNTTKVLVTKV